MFSIATFLPCSTEKLDRRMVGLAVACLKTLRICQERHETEFPKTICEIKLASVRTVLQL